ncbi:hypothetical protein H0H93_003979 [Arthromyces matolae]|nr:hypothetical protein H0H93_003979 [Arthromyces matolae]
MLPPEGSGDMDLWDGFGDDIHRSGVIDEGLVSRFTNSLVPESKKLESVDEVASRLLSMSAGAQHTNGANGAHPPINGAVSAPMSEGGANSATHEAAVTLASLTGGTNGPDREAALALVSMTGSANHRPPPSTDHVPLHMASSTSNT